jgi:hemoglobin/transferrin/lactoferrin receptor protein
MKLIIILTLACTTACAVAQNIDTAKTSYLDEVIVSANKIPEQRRTVAQQVNVINTETIRNLNAQTAADLLQNTGVVAMQRSQQGGGSPILRGFEASRVLLVVDGVRMNNLIYRAGHLQNVITIDNSMLDRAEVLFGPSSTVYGSDALGGVVHFYTRDPKLSANGKLVNGNAFIRYGSVNEEKTGHVDVNLGGKKVASLTSFTISDFGDLKMGEKTNGALDEQFGVRPQYSKRAADNQSDVLVDNNDPFVQVNSGYKQWDFLQKFLFKQTDDISHTLNFQYSTSTDIPRYDRLTDAGSGGVGLRFAEWYYGPQERLMGSYKLQVNKVGSLADNITTTISYQAIEESRHDRRFNNNNRNDRVENVEVWGLTLNFTKSFGKNNLRYGVDGQFNSLASVASKTDVVTKAVTPQSTRYPDGDNTMNVMALYATHTLLLSDLLTLTDGLRVGTSSLKSTFGDKSFFDFPFDYIEQNPTFASGNLGLIFTPNSWKFSLLGNTGYRVPNVDDLAKVFETVAGNATTTGTLVVPNPDLKPEKTINGDFGVTKFFGDKVRAEATIFATSIFDAIVTLPTAFNGQSTITYDGFPADVVSSQNAQKAYIYGYSASLKANASDHLSFTASYNYTRGRVKADSKETLLDHIAPAFGRIGVQYTTTKFVSELFSNFNGWKRLENYSVSGEDNLQYATAKGMPAWYTINLRASYQINPTFGFQAGADNLLDLQYRQFASGINSPGRNVFATIRVSF